jgi:predicted O-methyltransferase YrrM
MIQGRKINLLADTLTEIESKFREKLTIVETGTIRYPDNDGDGNSTRQIAQWMEGRPHNFFSVDLHTKVCDEYLTGLGLIENVQLVKAHSLKFLPVLQKIHFAYLDSGNEPEDCFEEFRVVMKRIVKGGIIICDDCLEDPSIKAKAQLVFQYCIKKNLEHSIIGIQLIIRL